MTYAKMAVKYNLALDVVNLLQMADVPVDVLDDFLRELRWYVQVTRFESIVRKLAV